MFVYFYDIIFDKKFIDVDNIDIDGCRRLSNFDNAIIGIMIYDDNTAKVVYDFDLIYTRIIIDIKSTNFVYDDNELYEMFINFFKKFVYAEFIMTYYNDVIFMIHDNMHNKLIYDLDIITKNKRWEKEIDVKNINEDVYYEKNGNIHKLVITDRLSVSEQGIDIIDKKK